MAHAARTKAPDNPMVAGFTGLRLAAAAGLILAMTGCASVDKLEVFPEQRSTILAGSSQADAPTTLTRAIALAEEAQRQWAESAREESDSKRRVSAGLLGLTFGGLIAGVTSPNPKHLAALGAGSAGLFAWGSTMTSGTRHAIYREGIETMACAVAEVAPYDSVEWKGAGDQKIDQLLAAARGERALLKNWVARLEPLTASQFKTVPAKPPPAVCGLLASPSCAAAPAGSSQASVCENLKPNCVARAAVTIEEKPDPEFKALMQLAKDEERAIGTAIKDTETLAGKALAAGFWLMTTGSAIEERVRFGVRKTEPDLETVLNVAKAMGASPSKPGSGAPKATSQDATGQSAPQKTAAGEPTRSPPAHMPDLQARADASAIARERLEGRTTVLMAALAAPRSAGCQGVVALGGAASNQPPGNDPPSAAPVTPQPKDDKQDAAQRTAPKTNVGQSGG